MPVSQHVAGSPARWLTDALKAAGSSLLFGLRLWASVSCALRRILARARQSGLGPQLGGDRLPAASRRRCARAGTAWSVPVVGAVMSVVLTACFPQDRLMFLGALALWRGMSALAATLLRNCAAYAAALAGYTATIVAGDLLGATGDAAFLIAISRGSEIIIGIVSAGVDSLIPISATPRSDWRCCSRPISFEITGRFAGTLTPQA